MAVKDAKTLVEEYQNESAKNRKSRLTAQEEATKNQIADLKKYGQLELARRIAEWNKTRNSLIQQIANSGGVNNPRNSSLVDQLDKVLKDIDAAETTTANLAGTTQTGGAKDGRPAGVPKDAKFNTVTGNWESGDQKWDTSGQAVTKITTKEVKGAKGGTPATTGTMPSVPTGGPTGPGVAAGAGFDPARFRMGEEASMGAAKPVISTTPTVTPFEKIMAEAVKLYGGIDEIFATNEELKNLLIRSIGDPATAKDDMDEDQFINLLQNTTWYKTNSGPIRQRGFEKRQYDALVKKLKTDDPQYKAKIEELNRTSAYGRGLQDVIDILRENATKLGRQISDDDLRVIAAGIYDYANEDDAVKIRNAILGAGTFGAGKGIVSGAAGQNLTTLRAVARANGFDLDTVFKDSIDTWLDKIAKGESIETFKSVIRNTAKAGLPDRVASLLDQGVDLETIYSPYKRIMAATLEVSPESITLNDPTLRMGIGPDKEVSLYEYQRMLRKDPRWQYTNNAREDVANSVLTVARNFGFQG
jgi:hypothetical protein